MENADKPINPVLTQGPSLQNDTSLGLTKREHYAGLAMQGLLASNNGQTIDYLIHQSIKAADELLKQLENK